MKRSHRTPFVQSVLYERVPFALVGGATSGWIVMVVVHGTTGSASGKANIRGEKPSSVKSASLRNDISYI